MPKIEKIISIRNNLNETSKHRFTIYISFLLFISYFLLTVLGTTQIQLFIGSQSSIPLLNINIPIVYFYVACPIIVLVMHIYCLLLFLQTAHISLKFHHEIIRFEIADELDQERDLLFPFLPSIVFLIGYKRPIFRLFTMLITILWIGFLAPIALLICQMQFIAYHNLTITFTHQIIILIDLIFVTIISINSSLKIGFIDKLEIRTFSKINFSYYIYFDIISRFVSILYVILFFLILTIISLFVEDTKFLKQNYHSNYFIFNTFFSNLEGLLKKYFPDNIKLPDNFSLQDVVRETGLKPNFENRDFSNINAVNADFSSFSFIDTNFSNASLISSNFFNTNLTNTNFNKARIWNANFSNALLDRTKLNGASLLNTNFNGAKLYSVYGYSADFRNSIFIGSTIHISDFEFSNFSLSKINATYIHDSDFFYSDFSNSQLIGILTNSNFDGTNFKGSTIIGLTQGYEPYNYYKNYNKNLIQMPISLKEKDINNTTYFPKWNSFIASDFTDAILGKIDLRQFNMQDAKLNFIDADADNINIMWDNIYEDINDLTNTENIRDIAGNRLTFTINSTIKINQKTNLELKKQQNYNYTDTVNRLIYEKICHANYKLIDAFLKIPSSTTQIPNISRFITASSPIISPEQKKQIAQKILENKECNISNEYKDQFRKLSEQKIQ